MSIIFAGSEPTDFDSESVVYGTGSVRDSTYARIAVSLANGSHFLRKTLPAAQTELWLGVRVSASSSTTADSGILEFSAAGVPVLRVTGSGVTSDPLLFERWVSGAWEQIGTLAGWLTDLRHLVMRARIGSSGLFQLYYEGTLACEWTGDTSGYGAIDSFTLRRWAGGFSISNFSEVIAATHDIRSARLKTLAINGAGAINEWAGAYTDIDAYNETDDSFIASDTAEQKALFTKNELAADSLNVDAVIMSGRFRQNTAGPSNIDAIMRVDGNDYGKNVGDIGDAFEGRQVIFAVNPATSAPWTREAVEAAQIGLQSKA